MSKIIPPLTDTGIKALKPKDKDYKKSDGKNLFIIVKTNGKKVFAFEYKSPSTNKIRRISLGLYPDVTLAKAREKRLELVRKVLDGIDPLEEKKQDKNKFKDIALAWIEIKRNSINESSYKKQIMLYDKYLCPYLGDKGIDNISVTDIINTLKIIENAGSYITIKRVFSLLNQIYKYAVSCSLTKHNIIADINYKYTFKLHKTVHYPTITDTKDIKKLLISVDKYSGSMKTRIALKLAIHTAMRSFNIRSCRWCELDLENKIWSIPANKMKMKEDFKLPLSNQVIQLLKENRDFLGTDFLFQSNHTKAIYMGVGTLNVALRNIGFAKDELVSHGFRAMFSTAAHERVDEHNCSSDIIERCLAHKDSNKVRAAYNRASNLKQMRILMQWWSDYLDSIISS